MAKNIKKLPKRTQRKNKLKNLAETHSIKSYKKTKTPHEDRDTKYYTDKLDDCKETLQYYQMDKKNSCIPGKGHAGHSKIYSLENGKYCLKKTLHQEAKFYEKECSGKYNKVSDICDYAPNYLDSCVRSDKNVYILMENLNRHFKYPIIMDIKLGFHSTYYDKKDLSFMNLAFKKIFHKIKDSKILLPSLMIGSYIKYYGFKVLSIPHTNINRNKFKSLNPLYCLSIFFEYDNDNTQLNKFIRQLEKINKYVQSEEFPYYSVSSSLLFIYDGDWNDSGHKETTLKLIDFPYTGVPETDKEQKMKKEFKIALNNVVKLFKGYSQIKDVKNADFKHELKMIMD
jgi:hypothetical protein